MFRSAERSDVQGAGLESAPAWPPGRNPFIDQVLDDMEERALSAPPDGQLTLTCACLRLRREVDWPCDRCTGALDRGWSCDGVDSPAPIPHRHRFPEGRVE